MKLKLVTILSLLAASVCASAQSAVEILDKTARMLEKSNGIEATFEATTFKGTKEQSTTDGTIYLKGEKFKIVSPAGDIWFDGKTQWSLYKNSDEVNVSTPTERELQSINPYTFVNLYKNGYKAQAWEKVYNGKACHEVKLTAEDPSKALKEMLIIVDKKTFHPYSIRLKQMNDWFRARINKMDTGKKWKDSFFKFNEKDYPNVEVIDLR